MDLFEGFFWTPGWTNAATLLLAPLIGLTGVTLTLRSQRSKFKEELVEKRQDALRDALADLLAHQPTWHAAAGRVLQFDEESVDTSWDATAPEKALETLMAALYDVTMDLQMRCVRVELLTRDRDLLVPIVQLKREAVRLENDPDRNWSAWDNGMRAYARLGSQAKKKMAVHGLDRPLVTDADPWRVRRREHKRAHKAGEAYVVADPLWKHLWAKVKDKLPTSQPEETARGIDKPVPEPAETERPTS